MNPKEKKLNLVLRKTTKLVEPVIKKILSSYVALKNRGLVNYQISTGGKRLRPSLALIVCQMLGGKIKDVLYPAAGLEILHNYTLIIDDIIDNSKLRRGKPTTWAKFGKSVAQCIAVDYSAAVFQAASQSRNPEKISGLFAETMKRIMDGEILDILFEQGGRDDEPYIVENRYKEITKEDYFKMIAKKTGFLIQTACEIGGICAGAGKQEIEFLKKYGFNLGLAFQIQDDILDIFGSKKFGKKIGHDIEERKRSNIIVLFALEEMRPIDKKKFSKILEKRTITKKDVREAIELIKKTKAKKKAYQLGEKYISEAKKNLRSLPQNKWNDILREAADFTIERRI